MIVGTERRHGFSQNDVDRQWHQIVDKIRKKQVDGVIVANMSVITDNLKLITSSCLTHNNLISN